MAFRGRLDPVDRLVRGRERGVEADAPIRADDVVVDGLGYADYLHASPTDPVRRGERPIAIGDDERVDPIPA